MKRLFMVVLCAGATYASTTIPLNENKRIEATIGSDSMNRLAVVNDRITQIFGDEGTFESQHDEATGQIFLKPTTENGKKNLSLTLITEQGATQDLTLRPTSKTATTVILKGAKPLEEAAVDKNSPYQEQLLMILKQAVMGQLAVKEDVKIPVDRELEGYQIIHEQTFQAGVYNVHLFNVENLTETSIEIDEKEFHRPGDLALSVLIKILPKGGKTKLYTVSRS